MPLLLSNNSELGAHASGNAPEAGRPGSQLAVGLVVIAVVWLIVLPAIAEVSTVREMIDRHEADGIDPSAKFYSELPAMPMISQRIDDIRQRHPKAFGLK
jgi:hypothetical protein